MTKSEFISKLSSILEKNQVEDAPEIIEEYEQHFAFKLADGYSEEEIAAKLGDPEQLGMQYERGDSQKQRRNPFLTRLALGITEFFGGIVFLLITICGVVFSAASVAVAIYGGSLIIGVRPFDFLPVLPYWCGAVLGVALIALATLGVVGCVRYWSLLHGILLSWKRFRSNMLAGITGEPKLPDLPIREQLSPKVSRRLRTISLLALLAFAVFFVLGFFACWLSAGALEFWHAWGWFGYKG